MDWEALAGVLHVPLAREDAARVIAPLENMYRKLEPLRAIVALDTPMWTPPEAGE
jgi:hypothetical protein